MLLKGAHGGSRKQGINRYGMDLVFRDTQKGNLHISVMIVAFAVIIRVDFQDIDPWFILCRTGSHLYIIQSLVVHIGHIDAAKIHHLYFIIA